MKEILITISGYLITYGFKILYALLIFFIGKWLAKIISEFTEKFMIKSNADKTLASFVRNLVYIGLLTFIIVAVIEKMEIKTTSIVAVIGAAGLAVGLAMQGSLSNFAAGVMLVIFKPFKIDDLVEISGTLGTVEEIQIFNTILRSLDNKKIIFPNSKITSDKIINYSATENRRVDMVFGISYDDDIKKAKEVLERIVVSDSRVLKDPEPVIAVSELGDNSVNLVCRPWVNPDDYWGVYFDTLEKGKLELGANGITIPFPQRDVHLYEEKKVKE